MPALWRKKRASNVLMKHKHYTMKKVLISALLLCSFVAALAQDEEEEEKKSFKENLFTGGSVSLSFFNNTFLVGASPVFGYSPVNWADVGIVVNYNYTSYRDVNTFNDRLRQQVYGGGGFVKLYPVRFLFAQGQVEHNYITQKYIPPSGASSTSETVNTTSYLIGGGYTSGREGRGGQPFYYLALLFDISGNINSPYTDAAGRTIPIIRAGLQVPLFQGGSNRRR
jgi:hypothetical protein